MNDSLSPMVQQLAGAIRRLELSKCHFNRDDQAAFSTGIPLIDRVLPYQGLLRGTLTEWISKKIASGAMTLATLAARQCQQAGPLLVIDSGGSFHLTAASLLKLSTNDIIIVQPRNRPDALWAMEQSLRCTAVAGVLAELDFMTSVEYRRLQLAAETGNTVGMLVRSGIRKKQNSWSDLQFHVEAVVATTLEHTRRLRVTLRHTKGCYHESTVILDVCDETGSVHLVSELPTATIPSRATGA